MLRYVDETSASIWVETAESATVVVRAEGRSWRNSTFAVHGHHYALVEVAGLEPGSVVPYTVEIGDATVWPPADSPYPPSCIATLKPGKPLRLAFGSCRTSAPHDREGNRMHGVDAMRAYALAMADHSAGHWPDLLLFLGDQVYADETTKEMRDFIEARRDITQPPWEELKDYQEYAHLYRLAWTDPANRWLLSTLPTSMIFDDHDIRDDWNTSLAWRRDMQATTWWHERIVSGLASYWVYQHLGNLSPAERATDEIWQRVVGHSDDGEPDLTEALEEFADRVDQQPETYRWSYARDLGRSRLVVVDSRAARVLDPARRSILDENELRWFDQQLHGDCDHLFIGTSLPYLLAPGLHFVEAWSEALAAGGWGKRLKPVGEKLRRTVDLEHWAAFQHGFQTVAGMIIEVARGRRGRAPRTITFLSGDVHHSYLAEVRRPRGEPAETSRIIQAVCSPVRNPLSRGMRYITAFLAYGLAGPIGLVVARSAKVPAPPFRWDFLRRPWFDNNLGTLEVVKDGLRLWWETGVVRAGDDEHPRLKRLVTMDLVGRPRA
nr:alkaline phosphatase D family protein [Microlunatus panaciterrae]